jgi:tetratricopeptide (TPR) repeat protein
VEFVCELFVDRDSKRQYYERSVVDCVWGRGVFVYLDRSRTAGMSVSDATINTNVAKSRRGWRYLLVSLVGVGLIAGGWAWWTDRRYKRAMEVIESDVVARRYAIACRNLDNLLSWKADPKGGITYLLGSCELARGRNQVASEVWARIVPGTAFSDRAIRGRMRLLNESGQLAAAEQLIIDAARDPRNDRTALLVLLVPVYSDLGRIDEAAQLIEDRWEHLSQKGEGALEPAIKLVRQHIDLTLKETPVETVRSFLDRSAKLAPDDDRVWLGRANLAIRTGAGEEAERWLNLCRPVRPDDAPVWRATLRWGMATNRTDVVRQALTHLPAAESDPAGLHRVNAWLARQNGDIAGERRELELQLATDPAAMPCLERLGELAEKEGEAALAAQFRDKKADVERLRARYLKLHDRRQPIRDAEELARLAEQLGRRFEARVFLSIAISEDPERADLRRDLARLSTRRMATAELPPRF